MTGCAETGPPDTPQARRSAEHQRQSAPDGRITRRVPLGGGAAMEFMWIPHGEFMMGSKFTPEEVAQRYGGRVDEYDNEHPRHRVVITAGFWFGKHEVTQRQWQVIMGENPAEFAGAGRPVECVSWHDARRFIAKLNEETGLTFRLPTNAEWEYACRAGTQTAYFFGDDADALPVYAWFQQNSGGRPHPVGQKWPNPWGLHDMPGNVYEWCQDRHKVAYYREGPAADPQGPDTGLGRVRCGGSYSSSAAFCRSADRSLGMPDGSSSDLGVRLVLEAQH